MLLQKINKNTQCLWAASGNSECVQLSRLDLQVDSLTETKVYYSIHWYHLW